MVSVFGMSEKVGQVSFYGMQNESFNKPFSDDTASMIDEEVRNLVNSQYIRAQEVLTKHRDALEKLAQALLEKEVLLKSDVERLIGPRPFKDIYQEMDAAEANAATDTEDANDTFSENGAHEETTD